MHIRQQAGPRQQREAIFRGDLPRPVLETEIAYLARGGADENHSVLAASFRELGVFAEKSVAGMNRLSSGFSRGFEQTRDREITVCSRRRSDRDGFIGLLHMQRVAVRLRKDRDRSNPHATQGSNDAAGDRAAVRDEDFAEHHGSAAQISTSTGVGW